jgi:Transposase
MAHATAAQPITVGVDTHLDSHVAHAGDQLGRRVGTPSVPTTPTGDQDLLARARGLGQPIAWGVEGTGSYGAALARFLAATGHGSACSVVEVVADELGPSLRWTTATTTRTTRSQDR